MDLNNYENNLKKLDIFYKQPSNLLFLIIKLFIIYIVFQLIKNTKNYKEGLNVVLLVIIGYFIQEMLFISGHLVLHSEFDKLTETNKTNIAHYHHYIDPAIYERCPYFHRLSYFNVSTIPVILLIWYFSNKIIFFSFVLFYFYEIIIHESYHIRNEKKFYKTSNLFDLYNKPNFIDKGLVNLGSFLGIHNREEHRKHHIETLDHKDSVWDDLFLFGKIESKIKNIYFSFIYNILNKSNYKNELAILHFIFILIIILFLLNKYKKNLNKCDINFK